MSRSVPSGCRITFSGFCSHTEATGAAHQREFAGGGQGQAGAYNVHVRHAGRRVEAGKRREQLPRRIARLGLHKAPVRLRAQVLGQFAAVHTF